jgi:rubrerythrin
MFQEMTLRKAVELAVMTEQFSGSAEVERIFTQLARDERGHEARFSALLDGIPADKKAGDGAEDEQFLRAMAYSTLLDKQAFTGFKTVVTPADAIARALEFEKSTLSYYQAISAVIGKSAELDAIIGEERKHVVNLFRVAAADAKLRSVDETF